MIYFEISLWHRKLRLHHPYLQRNAINQNRCKVSGENRWLQKFTEYLSNSRMETDAEPKMATRYQMTSRQFDG